MLRRIKTYLSFPCLKMCEYSNCTFLQVWFPTQPTDNSFSFVTVLSQQDTAYRHTELTEIKPLRCNTEHSRTLTYGEGS